MHYYKSNSILYNSFIITKKNLKSKLCQLENLNLSDNGNLLKTY